LPRKGTTWSTETARKKGEGKEKWSLPQSFFLRKDFLSEKEGRPIVFRKEKGVSPNNQKKGEKNTHGVSTNSSNQRGGKKKETVACGGKRKREKLGE